MTDSIRNSYFAFSQAHAVPFPAFTPAASFLQYFEDTDETVLTHTFVGQNFGSPDATRIIYGVLHGRGGVGNSLASATIDGIGATVHVSLVEAFVGADELVAIFSAAVPTGASGDVVVTLAQNGGRWSLALYRVINQIGPLDDADSVAFASAPRTLTLTTVNGGSVIAGSTAGEGTGLMTYLWGNAVEKYDTQFATHGATKTSGALATSISGTSLAVTCTPSIASLGAFVAVSFH